jgi:hypothetical protein
LSFGKDVFSEGAFAQLVCTVTEGDEPLNIRWSFHGADADGPRTGVDPGLGISTSAIGSRTSILIIAAVGHAHRGNYTCSAANDAGSAAQTTQLRVNGRMDAQHSCQMA